MSYCRICRFKLVHSCHDHRLTCTSPSTGRTYQLLSDDEDEDEDEPFEISDDEPCDVGPFEVSDDDEEIQRKDSLSTSTPESKANTMPRALDATADDDVVEIDPAAYESSRLPTKTAKADVESVHEAMEVSDSRGDSIASSDCEPSERPIGRGSSVERAPIRANIEADDNNQEIPSDSGIEFSDDASLAGSWPDSDNSDEDIGGFLGDDDFTMPFESPNPDLDLSVPTGPEINPSDPPPYDPTTDGRPQWLNPKPITQLSQIKHAIAPTTQAPLAPMFPSRVSVDSATLKPLDLEIDLSPAHLNPLSMPSPSDAALKGARATTPPWRTEKQEFLAARVDNRAKFAAHWMDMGPLKHTVVAGESSATGGSFGGLASKPNAYNQQKKPDSSSNSTVPEDIVSLREKPSVQAMLLESPRELPLKRKIGEITVDEPVVVTKAPETAQSIASARNIKAISDARAMRRAQAANAVSAHNKVSRAADVPMTTAMSVAAFSNALAKVDKPTPTPVPAAKSTTAPSTTLEPTQQDQERPSKRQKQEETKAARRFAYATFSGFVAGAGLFVALVATAPDFGGFV